MFGGNSYWFNDLRVDYAELRPVPLDAPPAASYPTIKMEDDPLRLDAYKVNHPTEENEDGDMEAEDPLVHVPLRRRIPLRRRGGA
jgi:hypothetical protein